MLPIIFIALCLVIYYHLKGTKKYVYNKSDMVFIEGGFYTTTTDGYNVCPVDDTLNMSGEHVYLSYVLDHCIIGTDYVEVSERTRVIENRYYRYAMIAYIIFIPHILQSILYV
jgi:hypothetical protein